MRILSLFIGIVLSTETVFATSRGDEYPLGEGAVIIEMQKVTPTRMLILWMVRPTKHPRETPDDSYTCPEYTRGNFNSGPTRISLVNAESRQVINTVNILPREGNEFDLPYSIRGDYYYHVEGVGKGKGRKANAFMAAGFQR